MPAEGQAGPGTGLRAMVDAWQRHRFYEGIARALLAVGRPLLLVLDNVQWCDQETLAFITFCLGLASGSPLLVAGTLRDDNREEDPELAAWVVRMRATGLLTEVSLGPLDPIATAHLAHAISGQPVPEDGTTLLHAATGGFPLYVIEAVRGTVDAARGTTEAARGTADAARDTAGRGGAALPAGDLAAVLRKRLEQPSVAAREVAGLAAAVGTDFTLDLLTEASDLEADIVVEAVDELWRRRILRDFADGYDFSHDLLREVAYAEVSPPKRWLFHRRIAQSLELLHADDTDAVAAQLAGQYVRGGRGDRALAYYQRAADVAAHRFAYGEAIRLHRESLSIIVGMRPGPDRDGRELAVLEAMAAPLNARFGYASPDLQHTLERSVALAESLGRKGSTITSLVSLWASRFVQGRTADSYQVANRALALAEAGSELSGSAHFAVGGSAISLGMPAEGLHHLEIAGEHGADAFTTFGARPDIHGGSFAAHAHWLLGHDDEALVCCDRAITTARAIDEPYNLAVALAYSAVIDQMRGDVSRLRDTVGELSALCDRYDFAYYREWGLVLDGWARAGKPGLELARQGIRNLKAEGSLARMPYWLSLLAELLASNSRPDAARATIDAALIAAKTHDDQWWLPEVMRMRAGYDSEQAAIARLRSAAQLAAGHGSAALLQRCERDLRARGVPLAASGAGPSTSGVRPPAPGVRPAG
jgi:hypothetical protein